MKFMWIDYECNVHHHFVFIFSRAAVIVTFEQTEFTVNETVGMVELCLVIVSPSSSFNGFFFIYAESHDGTATGTPVLQNFSLLTEWVWWCIFHHMALR